MKVYGLTGGIATGKTTVEEALRSVGIPTFDADQFARLVVEPGQPAHREIVEEFGLAVLDDSGRIDRSALGRVVYRDAALRKRLEEITHPRIMGAIFDRVAELGRTGEAIAVVSAALLVEANFVDRFDGLVVITCSPAEQLRRIMARDGFSEAQARRRIEAQMPLGDKVAMADWVIDTNGPREHTTTQVEDLVRRWRGDYSS